MPTGLNVGKNNMKKILFVAIILTLTILLFSCEDKNNTTTTTPKEYPLNPPVDEHEHSYIAIVINPTCTTQGYTTYTCECNDSYIDNYVDVVGHSYEATVINSTCTEQGYTIYSCHCGDSYIDNYVNSLGHTFGNWETIIEATATEEGLQERKCGCGEKETRTISKKISEGLIFALNDDGLSYSVTDIGTCTDKDIIIPGTYEGLPVTAIADKAFYWCNLITSIRIPASVSSIGSQSFAICVSLRYIEVDENNKYYKSIDGDLYSKDGTILVRYAIGKQDSSFTIPNSVKTISGYAFYRCIALTSISISNSVIDIGNNAFASCQSLTSLIIPDSVKTIGIEAFKGCKSIVSVVIGDSVTSIGNNAFNSCSSLATLELGDSVESIGLYAFCDCTSLTSVTMSDSVKKIDYRGFSGCSVLTNIKFDGTIAQWNSIDKGTIWSADTGYYTIYCTDGSIEKNGTITYN